MGPVWPEYHTKLPCRIGPLRIRFRDVLISVVLLVFIIYARKSILCSNTAVQSRKAWWQFLNSSWKLNRTCQVLSTEHRKKSNFLPTSNTATSFTLKGLSHEIDFKNVDENWQILALTRAAAGYWIFQWHLWFLVEIKHLLSGKC